MPAGASSPYQASTAISGPPDSFTVGIPGKGAKRRGVVTASAFTAPERTWVMEAGLSKNSAVSPDSTDCVACGVAR